MTQKPKLSVGDRVRVYGPVFCSRVWDVLTSDEPRVGTITKMGNCGSSGGVFFKDASGDEFWAYSQQVRKLRPKQKPEKERERVERWISGIANFAGSVWSHPSPGPGIADPRRFVELREGEVVLGREELARAWDSMDPQEIAVEFRASHDTSRTFKTLAKAIGLGEDKA